VVHLGPLTPVEEGSMPDHPEVVQFARRFVVRREGQPDIHGVEFPSGRCLYDLPDVGLGAAIAIGYVTDEPHTVHWADADRR